MARLTALKCYGPGLTTNSASLLAALAASDDILAHAAVEEHQFLGSIRELSCKSVPCGNSTLSVLPVVLAGFWSVAT